MSCNINYEDLIFSVQKMYRSDKNGYDIGEYCIFIGNLDESIEKVLNKLEKREKGLVITKDDQILLKKYFSDYYIDWINLLKKRVKLRFIANKIHIDDTISEIRKKIFVYMSDFENKRFILPENQQLWLENKNGSYEIIGYYYENSDTKEKDFIKPSIYEPFNKNKYEFNSAILKKNTSENSMLIYDLIQSEGFKKKIIYLFDAEDEEKYLKSKKINVSENLINKYFKKYWPYINLSYNQTDIKNNYLVMKEYYNNENYIFNLIEKNKNKYNGKNSDSKNNSKNNKNKYFGSCNILTIKLSVNKDLNSTNNENNGDSENYVDLFPIFDYLRENKIDEKTPFIKYSEDILEAPFSIISKKAVDNNKVSKDNLKGWLGLNNEHRRMNGIIFKRFLKEYNNEHRYSSIFLRKSGEIIINVSFDADNCADFYDIETSIKDCKKIIDDINRNRVVKKTNEKQKIESPDMDFKNNNIIFKKNTKLIFLNIIIPLNYDKQIDFEKLSEFSKKFPYFLTDFPKDINKKNEDKTENSLKLKYKRISGFANMNDIILEIDRLKQKYDKDISFIIKTLEKKYQKSINEIKGYLLEWEKKYSSSKTSKVSSEFKTGILVTITNNNILINGITKIYQIPIIYNFFFTFMKLFNNYDDYLKNKEFKKFFAKNLNLNSTLKYYNEDYELNKNVKLNIDEIYDLDYDIDDDLYLDDEINDIYDEEISNFESGNSLNKSNIVGLTNDSNIHKDVKLTCDDKIPEKDTCEDFCNDQNYFLRRLQRYDNKLFNPKLDKKDKLSRYSRKCAKSSNRQPIVLPYDPSTDSRIKKDSYTYSVKSSSSPDLFNRWYICPKVWCPYCEIPILESEIDPKSIKIRATRGQGGSCKTAICPYGNHQVFIREGDHKFPGFLDKSAHPEGFCMPCCFKLSPALPKSSFYPRFKKCIGDEVENENIKDGQIYILGKGIPIEKERYGRLPYEISNILKTDLDTGYLGYKYGYLRKGIKHAKNNSFLSCICDILSCDKANLKIDISKIKSILIDKLNEDTFRSLYGGNLQNIFNNPSAKYTPYENYKNYLLNEKIDIDHKYLWDYLQRENILFENGVNIFIFENNTLLCPKEANVKYFYNISKKSILIIKSKEYYEPIYYLEGDGKTAKSTCIFDNDSEEIKKIFELSFEGCVMKDDIDWMLVLKDNIKKYDLHIDNITTNNGETLQVVLNEILLNVQNKKLNNTFLPKLQYVDHYNKAFGLLLNNGLYIPISPSSIVPLLKYKIVFDVSEIEKISLKEAIKLYEELKKKTNLKCNLTHKVLDIKSSKNIIALVNENNRFIPIINSINNDKTLKISNLNYYSDINESLNNKIEKTDKRIEIINKKNFEDETYIRLKFDLSKFLQMKEHKEDYSKIMEIINSDDKNIIKNRKKMFIILNNIYDKIVTTNNNKIDYYNYKVPNKRVPCFLRNIKSKKGEKDNENNNKNIKLSCEDDPHCVVEKNSCKLFVNKVNLLDNGRKYNNYIYYVSRIVDELLRFKMKRNEILNDNIPNIINKELIDKNTNKYIIIHTLNYIEIENIIEKLFLDNKGLFINSRKLYENTITKDVSFKKDKYIKSNKLLFKNYKIEDLSIYWNKILGNKFKVKISENENLLSIIIYILSLDEFKNNIGKNINIDVSILKNKIIKHIKSLTERKNNPMNEESILDLYKKEGDKIFKYIITFQSLLDEILSESYNGSDIDLLWISQLFNLNIIILDKRLKKNNESYKLIKSKNYKSDYFILLYRSIVFESNIYNIIQSKNKLLFKYNELPNKLINMIIANNNK